MPGTDELVAGAARPADARIAPTAGSVDLPAGATILPGEVAWRPRVIAVLSPKGGLGKTTIAANLAVGLARLGTDPVVLVDADLQFGDVANVLGLAPAHALPDLVTGVAAVDDIVVKALLTAHPAGFFTVCGAGSPEGAEDVTGEQLAALVRRLAGMFRYVIVDTTPALGEHTLAVLDEATDAVAISGLAVPNLRALRNELAVLRRIGFAPDSLHVVVNQAVDPGGLIVKDAVAILGRDVDVVVPHSKAVPLSTNRGVPVLVDAPKDPAARAIGQLLGRLSGAGVAGPSARKRKERR
jgi:pilus assembly protein CpaE